MLTEQYLLPYEWCIQLIKLNSIFVLPYLIAFYDLHLEFYIFDF